MKLRVQVGASGTNVNMLQAMEQAAIAGDVATGHDRDMDHSIYFGSVLRPVVSIPPSLLAVTDWLPHSLTLHMNPGTLNRGTLSMLSECHGSDCSALNRRGWS